MSAPAAKAPTACVSTAPSNTVVGAMPMTKDDTPIPTSGVPITEAKERTSTPRPARSHPGAAWEAPATSGTNVPRASRHA